MSDHQRHLERLCDSLRRARPQTRRTLLEFAEQEIVIPDGPFRGEPFRASRQPWTRALLEAMPSWRRVAVVAPTQVGKTLCAFIVPALYGLFELGETVICGLPDMNMAADKWSLDLLPALRRTRYSSLLPDMGAGSRGGRVENAITFANGATLKFMSGGGSDAKRSAFTSRIVLITESDKLDAAGGGSRETDKIGQMEARADAYGDRAMIVLESTASYTTGRIWREYKAGSESRIVCPCPACGRYVHFTRTTFRGWESAETEHAARQGAAWHCPECDHRLSEAERAAANAACRLLHRGQSLDSDGAIVGDPPKTDTLGFRVDAFNNLFWTAGTVAARHFRAAHDRDPENAERGLSQFVWAIPCDPPSHAAEALDWLSVARRVCETRRGTCPADTEYLVVACDVGKRYLNWTALALNEAGGGAVIDYNLVEVHSAAMATDVAIAAALREFLDLCAAGWAGPDGQVRTPDIVLIDSGYEAPAVYAVCRESGSHPARVIPAKGLGVGQTGRAYHKPKTTGSTTILIGDGYHVARLAAEGVMLAEIDADAWKTHVHNRLTAAGESGDCWRLFNADPKQHQTLARHVCAETQVEEYVPGRGQVLRWENVSRRPNHYFDCLYMAAAAGHIAGARVVRSLQIQASGVAAPAQRPRLRTADGRPFLVTQR